ncbi:FtsK/SpoIIIE domain-containing protein [Oerskovia sp. NPDC060338]|uniref:FtsK/SpoIIIE domain-containing protein n=1 Tax=Oerskovia sp. NPDC060338 TaxID=3347100 RepID=UPI0036662F0B
MAAARTAPPTPPSASWTYPAGAVAAGVAGGVWALANGWPGVALVWVSFALAGWLTQPPTLTGPLDAAKRPTVANPAEKQGLSRYRFWSAMRWRVLTPNAYWWPLEPAGSSTKGLVARLGLIRPANVLALVLAAAAAVIPAPLAGSAGWVLSAVGAYATFAVVVATKRACANEMHPKPAVTFSRVAEFAKESPSKVVGSIVGALVLGGASALVVLWFTPSSWGAGRWVLAGVMPVVWAWVLLARPVIEHTVTTWRALVAADEMWQPRWEMMKLPEGGRPFLIEHADLGESVVSVDTFRAPAALGAAWFHQDKNRAQIVNAVGAGSSVVVLSVPNTDAQGQPMPGTVHPLDVRVVTWSTGTEPDYATTAAPIDLVQLVLECAVAEAADGAKMARPLLVGIRPLTEPGTATAAAPQNPDAPHQPDAAHEEPEAQGEDSTEQGSPIAYEASWDFPQAGSYETLGSLVGPVQERMQVMVRVDHRSRQMFLGDLDAVPDSISQQIENLHLAAKWTKHWADALKQGTKGPLVQPGVISSAELANGTEVHCVPFAVGQGQNPLDFFGYEENLASTVNVAFITTTGFCPPTRGARPGERHNLGLTLLYSQAAVPMSPHLLAPSPGRSPQQAQRWVLAGMVNKAFDAAKMARPEVVNVKAMSAARSRGHIWALTLRLYGGVTTADVRRKVQVIAQTWGVPWVRLGPASEDTITLFAGANPSSVTLADPATDEMRITALDWEQAWADAKVVNPVTGAVPTLTAADRLEHNDKVQVLDFALPQGISASQAKGALDKLRTNTGNSFILFRTSPDGAAAIRVLCSPQDPVPFPALCDFDIIDAGVEHELPFATGVEGQPVAFNTKTSAHALVAGTTGGGKSILLQNLIYGGIIRDWDIYIADPSKGAADFGFAEPYAKAIARTLEATAALMSLVYDEVKRRKDVNSQHKVGSFKDLPQDVRPARILLVLDEFTSLVTPDPVPKASEDPDAEEERMATIASNALRAKIGSLTGRVAREARSAGITLFLATQKLSAKMLDAVPGGNDLKANLARILLGNSTYGDRQSALRSPDDAPPLGDEIPPGRGLWEPSDGKPQIIQAWYTPGEQEALSKALDERRRPLPDSERADLAPYLPKRSATPGVVDVVVDDDPAPGAPEEVIDAGRVEFSMDDLQAFTSNEPADQPAQDLAPAAASDADRMLAAFTAGQFAAPEPEPLPAALAAPVTGTSTLLVLDVPAHLDPSVLALLADADVETVWVSQSPADEANRLVGINLASTTVGSPEHGWWKLDALAHLVASRPHLSRLVWLDPRAHEEMDLGLTHVEYATDLLDGVELVAPVLDADDGLSAGVLAGALAQEPIEEQVVAVDDFAPERPPAPAPAPADDDWAMGSVRPSVKAPPRPALADDDWSMA